jgi:hypothetical protein
MLPLLLVTSPTALLLLPAATLLPRLLLHGPQHTFPQMLGPCKYVLATDCCCGSWSGLVLLLPKRPLFM